MQKFKNKFGKLKFACAHDTHMNIGYSMRAHSMHDRPNKLTVNVHGLTNVHSNLKMGARNN